MKYPVTGDGRYFLVRGRLWRCTNPHVPAAEREVLVRQLMDARRAKGKAMRGGDEAKRAGQRALIDRVKRALGERGPVWWTDEAPDYNRHLARNTPYAAWAAALE